MPSFPRSRRSIILAASAGLALALTWPGALVPRVADAQGKAAHPTSAASSTAITSFKAVLDIGVPASAGSPATSIHVNATVVIPKGNFEVSATASIASGSGAPLTIDGVYNGKQICERMAAGSPWNCMSLKSLTSSLQGSGGAGGAPGGLDLGGILGSLSGSGSGGASSSPAVNPLTVLGNGASFEYKRIGTSTVEGLPSTGYTFSATAPGGSGTGSAWFETSTGHLLQLTANASIKETPKAKPQVLSMKLMVSNYNDPSLKIPSVKAGTP
jgi:hypothetical protein